MYCIVWWFARFLWWRELRDNLCQASLGVFTRRYYLPWVSISACDNGNSSGGSECVGELNLFTDTVIPFSANPRAVVKPTKPNPIIVINFAPHFLKKKEIFQYPHLL